MTRYMLFLVLLGPVAAADEIIDAPGVRSMCWQLLAETRFGFSHVEAAAFIVRDHSGYRSVEWPSDGGTDSAKWFGQVPAGVVAIIHTHPNWMSTPSNIDARTARSARVPVYVITRTRITKTDGNGMEIVMRGEWKPGGADHHARLHSRYGASAAAPFERITSE